MFLLLVFGYCFGVVYALIVLLMQCYFCEVFDMLICFLIWVETFDCLIIVCYCVCVCLFAVY